MLWVYSALKVQQRWHRLIGFQVCQALCTVVACHRFKVNLPRQSNVVNCLLANSEENQQCSVGKLWHDLAQLQQHFSSTFKTKHDMWVCCTPEIREMWSRCFLMWVFNGMILTYSQFTCNLKYILQNWIMHSQVTGTLDVVAGWTLNMHKHTHSAGLLLTELKNMHKHSLRTENIF